jgi:hypothetical protein
MSLHLFLGHPVSLFPSGGYVRRPKTAVLSIIQLCKILATSPEDIAVTHKLSLNCKLEFQIIFQVTV